MTEESPEERFQRFLKSYKEDDRYKYRERIAQLGSEGSVSLVVDFADLNAYDHDLALRLIESPDEYLRHANEAAMEQLKIEDPEYSAEVEELHVRLSNLTETTPLRKIGSDKIGKLIMVDGIVVRASPVKSEMIRATYRCQAPRCGRTWTRDREPFLRMMRCENPDCRGMGTLQPAKSEFVDVQHLRIQERPEELPPGQLPRWTDVDLRRDMVDLARPGDRIALTAIVRATQEWSRRGGRRSYDLLLDANHIDVSAKRFEMVEISPEEEKRIRKLAKDPNIIQKLVGSIAPSIYGYDYVKESVLYLLCSGVPKQLPDMSIRGDIHILLVGDPGTAKSQLLRYVSELAPRALYTSGRGSSAAGLTAAVLRDREGGMTLEAGALVLSDMGICSIDEFDKMNVVDRTSIHEAMAQQTVSIAKGGIVAILNARTSILAAANPKLGRYDIRLTVAQNVNLPPTILSRFDLIFIFRDVPSKAEDEKMASHITKLHRKQAPLGETVIPQDLLSKYIAYAGVLKPTLTDEAAEKIEKFFLRMRMQGESSPDSPIAITPRQLESLIRLAEARAKASLREKVTAEDAEAVINLFKTSLRQVGVDITTGKFDIDIIMTGKPRSAADKMKTILSIVGEKGVTETELFKSLLEYGIEREDAEQWIGQLQRDGVIYTPRKGVYRKV